ncbi:protein N-lysine methyltransferase METTL21A-like isoform X1 [Haliotis rufescens]|uniref:protein N-lysine methyltransferase METTL21A-like isoform X1 n=1 Tax=Haliotis rufescens TaxID=6454 RepID=UPI00201F0D64|nr:protein N-lysine methyltransferase METTL21A-like isoform X1 [Haliotis rufescens]
MELGTGLVGIVASYLGKMELYRDSKVELVAGTGLVGIVASYLGKVELGTGLVGIVASYLGKMELGTGLFGIVASYLGKVELGAGTGLVGIVASYLGKVELGAGTGLVGIVASYLGKVELGAGTGLVCIVALYLGKVELGTGTGLVGIVASYLGKVELGAGTGLVGIVASYLGGHVTVTERREAMPNLRKTVNSNTVDSCPGSITAKELDWTTDLSPHPQYDVILGADIVYIEDTFQALLRTLVHTAREDTVVLLSCRIRYDRDLHFLTLLESHFVVEQIHYDKSRDIKIFSAKKIKTKT